MYVIALINCRSWLDWRRDPEFSSQRNESVSPTTRLATLCRGGSSSLQIHFSRYIKVSPILAIYFPDRFPSFLEAKDLATPCTNPRKNISTRWLLFKTRWL